MRLLPVLVLVTGCASATPPPSSPSASAAAPWPAPRTYKVVKDPADGDQVLLNEAMRVCVDQAEQDAALVDHWIAVCGKRKDPEDPACYHEHEAMFDTLEMHRTCAHASRATSSRSMTEETRHWPIP